MLNHAAIEARRRAPRRSGQLAAWIKTKCERADTFVVVGFDVEKSGCVVRPQPARLHLVWRKGAALVFAGLVEIGIGDATARELHERLVPMR